MLENQLPQIVEQVVYLWVRQVVELDPASCSVEPAGNVAIGFDEQRRNPSSDGASGHLRQIVVAKLLGSCRLEHLDEPGQPRKILGFNHPPGAVEQCLSRQGIGIGIDFPRPSGTGCG